MAIAISGWVCAVVRREAKIGGCKSHLVTPIFRDFEPIGAVYYFFHPRFDLSQTKTIFKSTVIRQQIPGSMASSLSTLIYASAWCSVCKCHNLRTRPRVIQYGPRTAHRRERHRQLTVVGHLTIWLALKHIGIGIALSCDCNVILYCHTSLRAPVLRREGGIQVYQLVRKKDECLLLPHRTTRPTLAPHVHGG